MEERTTVQSYLRSIIGDSKSAKACLVAMNTSINPEPRAFSEIFSMTIVDKDVVTCIF